mgnify:CR=1 FL=1
MTIYTIQVGYHVYYTSTVCVEAETPEEAMNKAILEADGNSDGWDSLDDVGDSYIDAICEGDHGSAWERLNDGDPLPIPRKFSEAWEYMTEPERAALDLLSFAVAMAEDSPDECVQNAARKIVTLAKPDWQPRPGAKP